MLKTKYPLLLIFISVISYSCSTSRRAVETTATRPIANAYIERYRDLAVSEMRRTGVPASITLAQGMIESDFGRSTLAREANNHFGIKCHNNWTGPTITHHDDRRNECFRKYSKPEDSFYDHSDFLRSGSRYTFLFDIPVTDYRAWAKGLKKAGYATNPDYADMLIRKIEENSLDFYDRGYRKGDLPAINATKQKVSSDSIARRPLNPEPVDPDNFTVPAKVPRIMENNRIQYIIVREGESKESIEKQFQLLKWQLPRYNELDNEFIPYAGQILYLQPKRDRAEAGKETHITANGDTMYSISQKYGVKLGKLYEYNRIAAGGEPVAGEKIWLRNMKPVN